MAGTNGSASNPRARNRSRGFDVILWGATGFTGQLVAEYLTKHYLDSGLRWALAGRSRTKLEGVRAELAKIDSRAAALPLRVADSHDAASLGQLAAEAEVICTTVGPYAKYGDALVAECVRHGTDYCDLTGETQWIRRMIDAHHADAKKSGARIVNCCGFDSIPSDLGVLMLQNAARERYGAACSQIKFYLVKSRGGASGGTIASMLNLMDELGRDRSLLKLLGNPYSLNPEGERKGPDGSDQNGVRYDRDIGGFTAPFVMAAVNTRIVRRSNALSGYGYGRDFRYSEVMSFPGNASGALKAGAVAAGTAGMLGLVALPPTRKLLAKRLPSPGEGPSREQRERGMFEIVLLGQGRADGGEQFTLRGRVEGRSDPGYGETSKMLAESAVCLALQGAELSAPGGLLTPASAMGATLIERLRKAGMLFELD